MGVDKIILNSDTGTDSNEFYLDLFLAVVATVGEELYMKGNILLGNILPSLARSTRDLDIGLLNQEIYNSKVVPALEEFITDRLPGVRYKIDSITDSHNGGIKIYNPDGSIMYSVDISVSRTNILGVSYYNIAGYQILGSSVERIIADKALSTLSKQRFRRVKDFYDLFIILDSRLVYDQSKVYALMLDSIGELSLKALLCNYPFSEEVFLQILHAWNKLTISSFRNRFKVLSKPDIYQVVLRLGEFYDNLKIIGGD